MVSLVCQPGVEVASLLLAVAVLVPKPFHIFP